MNKSLYAIETEYQVLFDTLEQADGLPADKMAELLQLLEINAEEFKAKAEAYAATIRTRAAKAKELRAEADRLTKWARTEEALAERLKERILAAMQVQGLSKAETAHFRFGLRDNESVEVVVEASLLPSAFRTMEYKPDKTAIKAAIDRGESVPGAKLVTRQSLQIR